MAQLSFEKTHDPRLRREAVSFRRPGHENIKAGKDRESFRREFHKLDPLYKIWYMLAADPARPPTRYGKPADPPYHNILWLLVNDRKARHRGEKHALPIERGRATDPPFIISNSHRLHLEMIIAGRKPDEIEPKASVRRGLHNLRGHGPRHLVMSHPGLRIAG